MILVALVMFLAKITFVIQHVEAATAMKAQPVSIMHAIAALEDTTSLPTDTVIRTNMKNKYAKTSFS